MPERDLYAWALGADLRLAQEQGFTPNVDVYYCGDPQRAVVKVDLAGVELDEVGIEVADQAAGDSRRAPGAGDRGRVYQQVEIPSGPFRRVVELQVDVDAERATATYEDGVLRIELPLRDPSETTRRIPIGGTSAAGERRHDGGQPRARGGRSLDAEDAIRASEPLPDALPVLPLRETVTFPETVTPLAVGQERSIKLVDDVLGANRMLAMVASRDPRDRGARSRKSCTRSASSASSLG